VRTKQWIRVVELEQMVMDAESGHRGFLLTGGPPRTAHCRRRALDALADELAAVYRGRDAQVAAIVQAFGRTPSTSWPIPGGTPTRPPRCQEAWYEARLAASSLSMLGSRS